MRLPTLSLLPLLAACASAPAPPPPGAYPILHYVRSNQDGSEPEHVVHFRPSRETIAVYKWVSKCTNAAYVTAVMDGALREAVQYRAGRVGPDGSQQPFGELTVDESGPALVAEIDPPGGAHVSRRHPLRARPFIIYDFDFADLNSFLQEHRPTAAFSYELPVVWPGEPSLFRDLGRLHAIPHGVEQRLGRATRRFDLSVEGPSPSTGALWIDAAEGFIVEAELGLPNHAEYRDFRLRLEKAQAGGQAAFDALTAAHHAGCPTGN